MTQYRLENYQNLLREREQIKEILAELDAALCSPKIQRLSDMPSAPRSGNAQEELIIKKSQLQARYEKILASIEAEQLAIEEAIESLSGELRVFMRYKYILGLKNAQISNILGRTDRHLRTLRRRALVILDRRLGPDKRIL